MYDIRGLSDLDLTPDFSFLLGQATGLYFLERERRTILIGRDNRISSSRISQELTKGLNSVGCQVVDIGLVATPTFYFATKELNIDAGIMVTASHNPPEYNGFKILLGQSTIYGEEIQKIKELMLSISTNQVAATSISNTKIAPTTMVVPDINEQYLRMLWEKIKLGPRKLKVGIDCGNGTASLIAKEFFEGIGCQVVPLYTESDGSFPNHHPDPVDPKNMQDLKDKVLTTGCHIGIGFDGDGDRLGVIDDKGNMVWGDKLMILFWRELLPKYPGSDCIVEIKCSEALIDEIKRLGGNPIFYKTGHSLIKAKMREINAIFAGEMSGHIFFADEYYGFDDALYSAGRLLRILSNTQEDLSQLLSDIPKYYSTAETRVPCNDKDKFKITNELAQAFKEEYKVIDIDGARIIFPEGWGLIRPSNTQPVIVARCEAKTEDGLVRICHIIKERLKEYPQIGTFQWNL